MIKKFLAKSFSEINRAAVVKEYYYDSYLFKSKGKVIQAKSLKHNAREKVIYLNSTIFHTKCGGQPCDTGYIYTQNAEFRVHSVLSESNQIAHYGIMIKGDIVQGEDAMLVINSEDRKLYSRLHSAGHMIDIAFRMLGHKNEGAKGYHYPKSAFVEYAGTADIINLNAWMEKLEAQVNSIIKQASNEDMVLTEVYKYDEYIKDMTHHLPLHFPSNSDVRVVKLIGCDVGCLCGGTHVKHVKEIGEIRILKAKSKTKKLVVFYNVM